MTISSKTLLHISGVVAFLSASYAMAQNGRPAPIAPDNAALAAKVKALETELAATKKDVASLQSAQKTIATQGFQNKGEVSALRKAYNKHTHWQDFTVNNADKQVFVSAHTSLATEFCGPNPQKFGESKKWNNLYNCKAPQ